MVKNVIKLTTQEQTESCPHFTAQPAQLDQAGSSTSISISSPSECSPAPQLSQMIFPVEKHSPNNASLLQIYPH